MGGVSPEVSVVVPAYNEQGVLGRLEEAIRQALDGISYEIVFVNDGSADETPARLDELARGDERIKVVHFSRNFGHQAALLAGLRHSSGQSAIVMDADMQDDPGALPQMVQKWREGFEVVYAVRVGRKENVLKRALFFVFYRFLNAIIQIPMPEDAGNFGLIDRRVADLVAYAHERDRYFAGLRGWVGFRQVGITVERGPRYDGEPRVSMLGLLRLAKSAIFSFSTVPLTIFYAIATAALAVLVGLGGWTLYHKFFTGLAIPGWTSQLMTACFFGALNCLGIGILGEYVIRIYDQVRARPQFIVDQTRNLERLDRVIQTDMPPPPEAVRSGD